MPVSGNTFDDQSVEQIAEAVTWVKRARRPTFDPRRLGASAGVTELFEAMVTDGTPDGDGHYEAVIVQWDQADLNYDTFDEVRLRVNSGETLTVNKVYGCRPSADTTTGGFRLYDVLRGVELPGSGITVKEVDGSPSLTGITEIRVDQTDGFVVTNPAAGAARLDLASASLTQNGIIDTTDGQQKLIGHKLIVQSGTMVAPQGGPLSIGGDLHFLYFDNVANVSSRWGSSPLNNFDWTMGASLFAGALFFLGAPSFAGFGCFAYNKSAVQSNGGPSLMLVSELDVLGCSGRIQAGERFMVGAYLGADDSLMDVGTDGTLGDGSTVVGGIVTSIGGGAADAQQILAGQVFWSG